MKENIYILCLIEIYALYNLISNISFNYRKKGREIIINDKCEYVYEGDYLFKSRWNGKEYDKNRNVIFEYINGDANGKIEMTIKV